MFAYGFEVEVERPAGFDQHGNKLSASTHTISMCARDQLTTLESIDGQQVVVTTERVLCDDADADVAPRDVLILPDGSRWQVSGEVDRPRNPFTGWAPGCVIPVERATS